MKKVDIIKNVFQAAGYRCRENEGKDQNYCSCMISLPFDVIEYLFLTVLEENDLKLLRNKNIFIVCKETMEKLRAESKDPNNTIKLMRVMGHGPLTDNGGFWPGCVTLDNLLEIVEACGDVK